MSGTEDVKHDQILMSNLRSEYNSGRSMYFWMITLEPRSSNSLTIWLSPVFVWMPMPLLQSNGFIIHLLAPKFRESCGWFKHSLRILNYNLIAEIGDI